MLDQDEHSAETRQRRWVVKGRTLLESKIGEKYGAGGEGKPSKQKRPAESNGDNSKK